MKSQSVILDESWYQELGKIYVADDTWLKNFCQVTEAERERFFENEVENPRFSKCDEGSSDYIGYRDMVTALKERIERDEKNPHVKELYLAKLGRQLDFVPLYKASEMRDDVAFHKLSLRQHGKPGKRYFSYVARRVKEMLAKNANTSYVNEYKKLARVFSKIDTGTVDISADILPPVVESTGQELTAQEVKVIFDETLERCGIEGWEVEIDASLERPRFAVSSARRRIYIPSDTMLSRRGKPLTEVRARALAEHEIGVHVRRSWCGAQQPLRLLGYGLAGYIRGEEGLASYVQQQEEGATEFYGFERYLALSLAMGMDGQVRDFRALFDILEMYYLVLHPATAGHKLRARNAAWEVCIRCFRGSTGQTPGSVYTRDLAYMEGNIAIWDLLVEKPHVFEQLFIGKFDPTNKKHVEPLVALGIIDSF